MFCSIPVSKGWGNCRYCHWSSHFDHHPRSHRIHNSKTIEKNSSERCIWEWKHKSSITATSIWRNHARSREVNKSRIKLWAVNAQGQWTIWNHLQALIEIRTSWASKIVKFYSLFCIMFYMYYIISRQVTLRHGLSRLIDRSNSIDQKWNKNWRLVDMSSYLFLYCISI